MTTTRRKRRERFPSRSIERQTRGGDASGRRRGQWIEWVECRRGRPWPNVLIRASAGTGKTFQLSNRYLQLVGAGVRPESILAATFARKAAGEILARVISAAGRRGPGRREVRRAGRASRLVARSDGLPPAAGRADRQPAPAADRHARQFFRPPGGQPDARARSARPIGKSSKRSTTASGGWKRSAGCSPPAAPPS